MCVLNEYEKLPHKKKLYFAGDFHLGAPSFQESRKREQRVVRWLADAASDAQAIFLIGDLFDFWFEYKKAIPKGFVRFQGAIARICDSGIPVHFFRGNHDFGMNEYVQTELGVKVHHGPLVFLSNGRRFFVGHGDTLGKRSFTNRLLGNTFRNKISHWLFQRIHPNLGLSMAEYWSEKSRMSKKDSDAVFLNEKEVLFQFCKETEANDHFDYYVLGHRHLPLQMEVNATSTYFNLGDWFLTPHFLEYDGKKATLKQL